MLDIFAALLTILSYLVFTKHLMLKRLQKGNFLVALQIILKLGHRKCRFASFRKGTINYLERLKGKILKNIFDISRFAYQVYQS